MGTRAIVGHQLADGTYRARHVGLDGYPTLIVPVLTDLVHTTFNRDHHAMVDALLRSHWLVLGPGPQPTGASSERVDARIGTPIHEGSPVETGRIATQLAGDRQWAYLITGDDLVVHRAVPVRLTRKRWKPWATWPIRDLPAVAAEEIERVQRSGIAEDRDASDFLEYRASVRRGIRERRS